MNAPTRSRRVWLWILVAVALVVLAGFAVQPAVSEFFRGVADAAAGRPPRA